MLLNSSNSVEILGIPSYIDSRKHESCPHAPGRHAVAWKLGKIWLHKKRKGRMAVARRALSAECGQSAQQGARNDQPLDLAGAFVDLQQFRIAE